MNFPWKKIKSKLIYQNNWIKVLEDEVIRPDGKEGIYSTIETNGDSVFIVALNDNNEIYLVNIARYPIFQFSLEIPGGNSDGENLLKAAKRELKEETGLIAKKWIKIGKFASFNGVIKEFSHIFLAQDLTQTNQDESQIEGIKNVKIIPLEKVLDMIKNNKIYDSQSIVAILRVALFAEKLLLSGQV